MLVITGMLGWILLLLTCIAPAKERVLLLWTVIVLGVHLVWSYWFVFIHELHLLPMVKWIVPHAVYMVLLAVLIGYSHLGNKNRRFILTASFIAITVHLIVVHLFFHNIA